MGRPIKIVRVPGKGYDALMGVATASLNLFTDPSEDFAANLRTLKRACDKLAATDFEVKAENGKEG